MGTLALIGTVIIGLIGFIIGWKFSDFLIPPRDYWTKSGATMWATKFGIALGGAYFAIWGMAALVSGIFS